METVIIVIHLMVVIVMCGAVLLQRSEGGALGIGGGGGGGGFMTGRGTANMLTRVTAVLAAAFFVTSIVLTLLAKQSVQPTSILDGTTTTQPGEAPTTTPQDLLRQIPGGQQEPAEPSAPQVPQSQ